MSQTDLQMRKTRGRLSRHVQNKLGETLHAMFDEIVKEGVPDRFAKLLDQIAESREVHGGRPGTSKKGFTSDFDPGARGPDPLVRAQGPEQAIPRSEDKESS